MLSFHLFGSLVLSNLILEGLPLLGLVGASTSLLVTVFTVEDESARQVPSLTWVRVVDHFSCSFHF